MLSKTKYAMGTFLFDMIFSFVQFWAYFVLLKALDIIPLKALKSNFDFKPDSVRDIWHRTRLTLTAPLSRLSKTPEST